MTDKNKSGKKQQSSKVVIEVQGDNLQTYTKHYRHDRLWSKVKRLVGIVSESLLIPILQLYYVLRSPATPLRKKLYIMGGLGYFILPTDLLPDFLPGLIGFTDDLTVTTIVIRAVKDYVTPEIKEKARVTYDRLLHKKR